MTPKSWALATEAQMARILARLTLLSCALLVIGCDNDSQRPRVSPDNKSFSVNPDFRLAGIDPATHVAGSLHAREAAAIAKLLAITPPEFADELQTLLKEPHAPRIYAVDDNEEAAQLLSLIYAIRDADYEVQLGSRGQFKPSATATVILVDELQDPNARALVVRRSTAKP